MLVTVTTTVAFAQGTVALQNQTGLVRYSGGGGGLVPVGGGYVQLFAAPTGTVLPHPLFTIGAGGPVLNYSSVAGFLASNPGWAGAWQGSSGPVPTPINFGPGLFNGGTFTINNISEAANADYFLLGWTGAYTDADAAIAAWSAGLNEFGESSITTTATGTPLGLPSLPVSLRKSFEGMTLYPAPEPTIWTLLVVGGMTVGWLERRNRRAH